MAYQVLLSNDVAWGDTTCRLLELIADEQSELLKLVAAARAKRWFPWVAPQQRRDGRWGAILEKDMPDSDGFGEALELLALDEMGLS